MRMMWLVEVVTYGTPHCEMGKTGMRVDVDFMTQYHIHAGSAQEALSKLPPGESQRAVRKVECLGSVFLILD